MLQRGRGEIDLGPVPPQDCEACGCEQPFRLCLLYAYERILVIFGNLRGRSYLLICEVCGTPYEVPPEVGRKLARLQRDPIPFLHRFGCLLFIGCVVILTILGWIFGWERIRR
jgi:hypothetical protein